MGAVAHIPTPRDRKIQRSVDREIYRQRNLVERYFCKLKHFRRCATRFDKLARNFLAAVAIASTRLWIRNYDPLPRLFRNACNGTLRNRAGIRALSVRAPRKCG